jgi:hypothetical protein
MGHLVELASLAVMLVFLAFALSVVGFGVSKLLHRVLDARRQQANKAFSRIAAAKSRAASRQATRLA